MNPYNHQEHLYSKNQPENLAFLERFRALLDEYNCTTSVGEVGDAQRGLEIMGEYTRGGDRVHMCYAFEFLSGVEPTADRFVEVLGHVDDVASDGWACWAFSNHDVTRHASRWNLSPAAQRLFATLMMCLRGSVCIYQGEELGLPEAEVGFEDLQDPYGIQFWPEYKGRDGCRTPMVWEPSNQNGGFTSGQPWLPVSHEHLNRTVSQQEDDPAAILHHYRRAIAFRHAQPALAKGDHDGVKNTDTIVHFTRSYEGSTIFCAFNLSDLPATMDMPSGNWAQIGLELGSAGPQADGKLHLGPWQPCLALKMNS